MARSGDDEARLILRPAAWVMAAFFCGFLPEKVPDEFKQWLGAAQVQVGGLTFDLGQQLLLLGTGLLCVLFAARSRIGTRWSEAIGFTVAPPMAVLISMLASFGPKSWDAVYGVGSLYAVAALLAVGALPSRKSELGGDNEHVLASRQSEAGPDVPSREQQPQTRGPTVLPSRAIGLVKRLGDRTRAVLTIVLARMRRAKKRMDSAVTEAYRAGWPDFGIVLVQWINVGAAVVLIVLGGAALARFQAGDVAAVIATPLTLTVLSSGLACRLRRTLLSARQFDHERTLILVISSVREFIALWLFASGLTFLRFVPGPDALVVKEAMKILLALATVSGVKLVITAARDYRHGQALAADENKQEDTLTTLVEALTSQSAAAGTGSTHLPQRARLRSARSRVGVPQTRGGRHVLRPARGRAAG